jgi:RNA polymerase sigma factor (sigma-70 family)
MAARSSAEFLRQICRRATAQSAGALPDAQLLELFVRQRHEAAFEVLVWRHGPLVLGVCRRLRLREQDAADVFQATFLTLVKKAGTIRRRDCLGSWLYQVAYRIALAARTKAGSQLASDVPVESLPDPRCEEAPWRDITPVLDEEVLRLPARYRTAFVLCCLEGLTQAEAAIHVGCPEGTIASRLAWARQRLRSRLSRRGISLAAGTLTLIPMLETVPRALAFATVQAACDPVALSKSVLPLAKGALPAMFTAKPLVTALLLTLLLGTAASIGLTTLPAEGQERSAKPAEKQDARKKDALPRAVLLARAKHKNYMKACFSFKHGTNDDPDLKITHNRWDVLYGNGEDSFSVNMVGGDQSKIVDLGKLQWSDMKDHSLLPPHREAAVPYLADLPHVGRLFRIDDVPPERPDDVAVKLGHIYLVHSKSDDYELFALFRVEEHTPLDRVVITWKVIPRDEARKEQKQLQGQWRVESAFNDDKPLPPEEVAKMGIFFSSKGRYALATEELSVGIYRLVGQQGQVRYIDFIGDEDAPLKGIFTWKDGKLLLVVGHVTQPRPTSLNPGPGRAVVVLERVKR